MREWAAEVAVDEALARRLIGAQFPQLELRSIRLLGEGWDMTVWLVDEQWVFRFPRSETVIPGLLNELSQLPRLASLLPLPIPIPTYLGEPSPDFRWPFYGAPFFPGASWRRRGWATPRSPRSPARSGSSFERFTARVSTRTCLSIRSEGRT